MNTKTEAEARKCWCPFQRRERPHAFGPSIETGQRCIASKCMTWRWHREPAGGIAEALDRDLSKNPERGYCGLAQR